LIDLPLSVSYYLPQIVSQCQAVFATNGNGGGVVVRERGSGVTPERVVELLKEEVEKASILAVSQSTGLGLAAIGRYLKGVGEPTTATLEKLAAYFGTTIPYLRGEPWAMKDGGIDFNQVGQVVVCRVCGAELQVERQEKGPLRVWPCKKCC
jgi:hypothetical protein